VAEIEANGGEAISNGANVTNADDVTAMVDQTMEKWGRVDVLINNAGILRDRSFGNMSHGEWNSVVDVHLNGAANCSLAVWKIMKQQNYGRILMTTSTSGIYGNFGQANYGAAKLGLVGLMNTLCIEGAKNSIQVNCLAPTAATRMTEDVIDEQSLVSINPEKVSPAAIFLVSENAPNRTVMFAGAGSFATLEIRESGGCHLPEDQCNGDGVAANFARISEMSNTSVFTDGAQHVAKLITMSK
jgi:NAD(P)-dependent dehydrogenase (short-subunit alcohol dehydrogenase family)